jgi:hypothetical protein
MVKEPIFAFISLAFLLAAIATGYLMLEFTRSAITTEGMVVAVDARNTTCSKDRAGSGRRQGSGRRRDCTRYSATVQFATVQGENRTIELAFGKASGHDKPLSYARQPVGSTVSIIYDPANSSRVHENTVWSLWGPTIMLLLAHVVMLLVSFLRWPSQHGLPDRYFEKPLGLGRSS